MNLTKTAIEYNRVTLIVVAVIILIGLQAYFSLPRAEDPGFIIRTAQVITRFPGASPERVEMLVTDKLEKAIQEMPELDNVTSDSRTGVSVISVNIQKRYTNMRPIWDSLRRKVDTVRPQLPEGINGPTVNDEFGDVFGIVVAVSGEGFSYAELKDVADDAREEFLQIDDSAKVDIFGAQDERIFVEYTTSQAGANRFSPAYLSQILQSQNIIISGGALETRSERIILEPSGNFESVEDLRRTVISTPGSKSLGQLGDFVNITRGYVDPPTRKTRANGVPVLTLAISMREGGNIISLGEEVKSVIKRLEAVYPIGVDFGLVTFMPRDVNQKVQAFTNSLLQALGIVLLVMLVTLGLRTGLLVASLIPVTMLMALAVMSLLNVGLDQMSLAALIIALGMLVDNAIVMSESILVRHQAGMPIKDAAIDSADELKVPLLTSSLTTAAAFLPIYLAESDVGEYTAPLFKVVTITLLCSWVLSLTMIPQLCVIFMKVKARASGAIFENFYYRSYRGALIGGLKRRWTVVMVTVGIFVLAILGMGLLPNIFFPPSDKPQMTVELELPASTPIQRMEEVAVAFDRLIRDELSARNGGEGVVSWVDYIGESGPRFYLSHAPKPSTPEITFMLLNLTSWQAAQPVIRRLRRFANDHFPDLKANIKPMVLGPPVTAPVEVKISGKNQDVLFKIVDQVKGRLASIRGTRLISDNWGQPSKKLLVKINQPRAIRAGVTSQDIAVSLQTILSGIQSTEFRENDKVIPVTLRAVEADRANIGKLETVHVYAQNTGVTVPLRQVADLEIAWQASKIIRKDRRKTVTVSSELEAGITAAEINAELEPWLEQLQAGWPIGYSWEFGGEAKSSGDANKAIGDKLPIAGFIILMLLVMQFNSVRRSFIVLMTIPLGLIGVTFGLLVAQSYFGFMTLLGVISLAGIVINNAIVLLDRIRTEIDEHGRSPQAAIVEAAQHRMRPILLTTATTVGGLLPLWFGGGPMWEPMAIAIIFGLLFSTMLTLGVVPVLYALLFRVNFKEYSYKAT